MVRGEKGWIGQQRNLRGQGSRHRVYGRDFQRGGSVETRQYGGNPFRQHRLARPGRPEQRQVMPARRAHLSGPPRRRLPEQLGEVRDRGGVRDSHSTGVAIGDSGAVGHRAADRAPRASDPAVREFMTALVLLRSLAVIAHGRAAKPVRRGGQAAGRDHAHAGHEGGLGRVLLGYHDRAEPGVNCGGHGGQHATDRPQLPVKAKFAEKHHFFYRRPWHLGRRGEYPDGYGQVEPTAPLGQAGRREPDRDLPLRPLLATVGDRGPDPVPRLSQRRIGQTDEDHPHQPVRDVRLDLYHLTVHTNQGHRVCAGQRHGYPTPRMCSMLNPPVPSYTRPTTSMRTWSNRTPWAFSHCTASLRSRARLARLTASSGLPYRRLVLALTSTTTRAYRSAATMSISPTAQRQLRSRIRSPRDSRYSAAACSPDLPSLSLACIAITSGSDDRGYLGRPQGAISSCGKPQAKFRAGGDRAKNVGAR